METKSEKLKMLESLNETEIADLGYEWNTPTSIQNVISNLPTFPIETLPHIIKKYAEAVAEHTQTPIDMSAISSLAVIASTLQRKYEVQGKVGYTEPLNLYCLLIANPAERKSAILREMTKYLYEYEKEENKKRQVIIDQQTIELNTKKTLIKRLENSKKEEDLEKAVLLQIECKELEEKQVKPLRIIADDCTPEALTSLLADNQGKLSIISAEGGIFDMIAGKYSKISSIDTLLKSHCGDPIRVDRKGRPTEIIQNPAISILLAIQENVLEGLMLNDTLRGKGLNARFLYCKPLSALGTRKYHTQAIPTEIKEEYKLLIDKLLKLPIEETAKQLILSDVANKKIEEFFYWLEPQLAEDLSFMGDWAGKLVGTCLRIAGILHLTDYSNIENENNTISVETVEKAIIISKYFLEHSKYAYMLMGVDKEMQKAKYILQKLEKQPKTLLKRHEIFKMSRNRDIQNVQDIERALRILLDNEYIRELPTIQREGAGRKPDIVYELNPLHFKNIMEQMV